jgi:hypothetical protein
MLLASQQTDYSSRFAGKPAINNVQVVPPSVFSKLTCAGNETRICIQHFDFHGYWARMRRLFYPINSGICGFEYLSISAHTCNSANNPSSIIINKIYLRKYVAQWFDIDDPMLRLRLLSSIKFRISLKHNLY